MPHRRRWNRQNTSTESVPQSQDSISPSQADPQVRLSVDTRPNRRPRKNNQPRRSNPPSTDAVGQKAPLPPTASDQPNQTGQQRSGRRPRRNNQPRREFSPRSSQPPNEANQNQSQQIERAASEESRGRNQRKSNFQRPSDQRGNQPTGSNPQGTKQRSDRSRTGQNRSNKPGNPVQQGDGEQTSQTWNRRGQRGRNQENLRRDRQTDGRYSLAVPSTPIPTNKGIKARSQRGTFSKNWWARRWIEAMELLVDPNRLQRGRSYARQGQVLSIEETQNGVEARVQGSRPQPYKVTMQLTPLTDHQWDLVVNALAEQALFTAKLLAGEMPENIEDAFLSAGVSLFPDQTGDLFTSCSCPDWANPCKHVAATHYILGDRFDDDPFLLFRMRGRDQEQILQALRERRAGGASPEVEQDESPVVEEQIPSLSDSIDHFWEPVESLDTFPLTIRPPTIDMPILKRLGEPAFIERGSLQDVLKPVYDVFTRSSLRAAYSEEEPLESSNGSDNENGG